MDSHSSNPDMQRAIVDINENRNERQKCVLLCALGRHLREISRALIADTKRLRDEGTALRKESGERQRN